MQKDVTLAFLPSLLMVGALCCSCDDDDVGPVDANLGAGGALVETRTTSTSSGGTFMQATGGVPSRGGRETQSVGAGGVVRSTLVTGGMPGSVAAGGTGPSGSGGRVASGGTSSVATTSSGCSTALVGSACLATDACGWSILSICVDWKCFCVDGLWTCQSYPSPVCGSCSAVERASCGSPCVGADANCLCTCGGTGEFYSCSCQGGAWQCPTCK
jgi:hypothetical protein